MAATKVNTLQQVIVEYQSNHDLYAFKFSQQNFQSPTLFVHGIFLSNKFLSFSRNSNMEEEKKENHVRMNQMKGSRRILEEEDAELQILYPKEMSRGRRRIKYCGIGIAVVLLQIVVIGILCLTIFRFKDPNLKLDSIALENLNMGLSTTSSNINMSMTQEIVIKNSNYGGFKYDESDVIIYYGNVTVGQGTISKGSIKARKSEKVSVVAEVEVEGVGSDVGSGVLAMKSYVKISGKVSMVGMVKKRRTTEMKCSLNVNLATKKVQDFDCHP